MGGKQVMTPRYSRDFLKTFSVMRAGLVSAWPNAHNERLKENIIDTSNTDKTGLLHEVYDLGNGDSVVGGTRHVNMAFCGATIADDVEGQVIERVAPVPNLEQHIPYRSIIANAVGFDLRTAALEGGVVAHRKNYEHSRLGAQKELSESGRNFLVGQEMRQRIVGTQNDVELARVVNICSPHVCDGKRNRKITPGCLGARAINCLGRKI